MGLSRRHFLKDGALFFAVGMLAPSFLTRTVWAIGRSAPPTPSVTRRKLVVVQLSGGNDGLNTVVPYADPGYYRYRPSIGIPRAEVLPLNESIGLHSALNKLRLLYEQRRVLIVQGVGYPNPNRSHFRSMQVWHTAAPDRFERTGWLGKFLEVCQCHTGVVPALNVGDTLNPSFWTEMSLVPAVGNLGAFGFQTDPRYRGDRSDQLAALQAIYGQAGNWPEHEAAIRRTALQALAAADELKKVADSYKSTVEYPANNPLASGLKTVAQVMSAELGTRVFYVSIGGFDTHAYQKQTHATLLKHLAEGVEAFLRDIEAQGRADEVLIMTVSEFGRRARENGSQGTDHGAGAPLFLIGNSVRGGTYGPAPNLGDLLDGDVRPMVDFRSVYATVLEKWLGTPSELVLGQPAQSLPLVA